MKLLPFQFIPEDSPYIEVVGIADLHAGAGTFNEKKALKHRAYVLETPDRKVIDIGDSSENALRDSPGSAVYEQISPPRRQREWVKEYYRPMRGRVLGVCASNHGDRSQRAADISPDELLAEFLDANYIRWEAVLSITVGDSRRGQQYNIFVRHSVGNCTTPASIINALQRKSMRNQGCDVYWTAHAHQFVHHPQVVTIPDPRHKKIKSLTQHLCCSDSFMEYDDSYAEQFNYGRPTPGQVSLRLYRDRHHVEVAQLVY
jgi:hypothetical protein